MLKERKQQHSHPQYVSMYLSTVCVPYPQHIRVVLGEEFGSAPTADTQLLITKNTTVCSFHRLRIERKTGSKG